MGFQLTHTLKSPGAGASRRGLLDLRVQLTSLIPLEHLLEVQRLDLAGLAGTAEGFVAGDTDVGHGNHGGLEEFARVKFAGFQHLCPIWKKDLGGVAMLKEALDWCDEHKVWVRDLFPRVSIQRSDRTHIIRLGWGHDLIYSMSAVNRQLGACFL